MGNRYNMREVSPYGLSLVQENWMLIARCDMRQDIRHFRLSRMTELSVLEDQFLLPPDFDLNSYRPPDDRNEQVLIRAKPEIADKIMEALHFYMDAFEEQEEGVIFHFRVRYRKKYCIIYLDGVEISRSWSRSLCASECRK